MISQIKLSRFKKFKNSTVKLAPFSILMGENSSGKTTVIQAINLALNIFSRLDLIADHNGVSKVRRRGMGMNYLPGLNISDFRELYYSKISRGTRSRKTGDGAFGTVIELEDEKRNKYRIQITSLFGSFNVKCISTDADVMRSPELQKKPPLFISGFVGLRPSEERSFPRAIQEKLLSGEASTIIRNLILDTYESVPNKYILLNNRLKKDFGFTLDNISFNQEKDIYVKANYAESCEGNRLSLDFNSSGSGFMQVLQILTPIYRFCPEYSTIVLLDEPDAHLHPNLQATLAKALREIQTELGVQIIISTHSTSIIRLAEPNEVIPISSNLSINEPLTSEEDVENEISSKIDTYNLGKSIISGKLIFVEDSKVEILEEFDSLLGTGVFTGANTIPILTGRGKDDKIPFNIKEVLQKFTSKNIDVVFLRDGDGLDGKWRTDLLAYSVKKNVRMHILERYEIESYLLNSKVILRTIKSKYPEATITSDEVQGQLVQMLMNTISMSKYRFDDNLEDSIYKTGTLLSKEQYRNPQVSKSEAIALREAYEKITDFDELLKVGMGKETLKQFLTWLNARGINIARKEIVKSLTIEDIPSEITDLLNSLKSKEAKESAEQLPLYEPLEDPDEIDEEIIEDWEKNNGKAIEIDFP